MFKKSVIISAVLAMLVSNAGAVSVDTADNPQPEVKIEDYINEEKNTDNSETVKESEETAEIEEHENHGNVSEEESEEPENEESLEKITESVSAQNAKNTAQQVLTIEAKGANRFEIEDFFATAVANAFATAGTYMSEISDPSASGGSYLNIGWTATLDDSATIDVLENGEYILELVASRYESYWGGLKVNIDGDTVINTDGTGTATEIIDSDFGALNSYSAAVYLEKGTHTVNLVTTIVNNHIACALDCISFYVPKEVTDVTVKADSVVKAGDEVKPVLYDQDGDVVQEYNYDSVTYTTTTPEFLKIDGGKITAQNSGTAKLKAEVQVGDKTYTAELTVTVAAECGLYIKSVSRTGEKINVTLGAADDYNGAQGGVSIMAVGYNTENGLKSLATGSKTAKLETDIKKGAETTVELSIGGLTQDMYVKLFMYTGNTTNSFEAVSFLDDVK